MSAYTCTHTGTHAYTQVYMHTCAHTEIPVHTYTYIGIYASACINIHRYTCIHMHTQVYVHRHAMHRCTCIPVHVHMYVCIHIHRCTCTHAHKHRYMYIHMHVHRVHMHTCAHTQVYVHTHACTQVCMHVFNIKEIPFFILFQQYFWAYMLLAHHKPGLSPRVSEYLRGLCMAGLLITRDLSLGLPRDSLLNSAVIQASTPTLFFYPSIPTPKRTSQKSL